MRHMLFSRVVLRWVPCAVGAILSVMASFPPVVSADVVPAGKRKANYCFRFANLETFPDYVFAAFKESERGGIVPPPGRSPRGESESGRARGEAKILGADNCLPVHSLVLGSYDVLLMAVPRADFDHDNLSSLTVGRYPATRVRIERGARLTEGAPLLLADRVWIDEKSTVERVVDLLNVVRIDNVDIILERGGRQYVYGDGSVRDVGVGSSSVTGLAAAGVLALLALAALRIVRRSSRAHPGISRTGD